MNFKTMINNSGLVDCFCHLYPSVTLHRGYTRFPFKAPNSHPNQLDALFIPYSIAEDHMIRFQTRFVTSDHTLISIKIRDKFRSKNVTKPKLKFKSYQLENEKNCDIFRETILAHLKRNNLISDLTLPTLHTDPKLSNFSDQNCSLSYVKIYHELIANLVSNSNNLEAEFKTTQDTELN